MILLQKSTYYRIIALYIKILDFKLYLENYGHLDNPENEQIIFFIKYWLEVLENEATKSLSYFSHKDEIDEVDIKIIIESINTYNSAFRSISNNIKYLPLIDPSTALKNMVQEIFPLLNDEVRVTDVYYKTISEDNFDESRLWKPQIHTWDRKVESYGSNIPNVLSMTALYHDNPLMWPLIFHEYGHIVFSKIPGKRQLFKEFRDYCDDKEIMIKDEKLTIIIDEIFADIFAINYYNFNFFFSFYFFEILPAKIDGKGKIINEKHKIINEKHKIINERHTAINEKCEAEFCIENHPPSIIRLEYMIKEIEKMNLKNDEVFQSIIKINNQLTSVNVSIGKKYRKLFSKLYYDISKFYGEKVGSKGFKLNYDELLKLENDLVERCPIGTSYKGNDLKHALLADKIFDIDTNNSIFNIIYAGWKCFISNIAEKFYEFSMDEVSDVNSSNKLRKFEEEYKFLLSNLKYSIETSMVTSYYLNDYYGRK
jgi:hypothetical protein